MRSPNRDTRDVGQNVMLGHDPTGPHRPGNVPSIVKNPVDQHQRFVRAAGRGSDGRRSRRNPRPRTSPIRPTANIRHCPRSSASVGAADSGSKVQKTSDQPDRESLDQFHLERHLAGEQASPSPLEARKKAWCAPRLGPTRSRGPGPRSGSATADGFSHRSQWSSSREDGQGDVIFERTAHSLQGSVPGPAIHFRSGHHARIDSLDVASIRDRDRLDREWSASRLQRGSSLRRRSRDDRPMIRVRWSGEPGQPEIGRRPACRARPRRTRRSGSRSHGQAEMARCG